MFLKMYLIGFFMKKNKNLKPIKERYSERFVNGVIDFTNRIDLIGMMFNNLEVNGLENVREVVDKQLIYVSNHVSLADFLVQGHVILNEDLPFPRFIAGSNLKHFPFGYVWEKCGAIFVDRFNKSKTHLTDYIHEVFSAVDKGNGILVYPEGGRSYNGEIKENLDLGTLRRLVDLDLKKDLLVIPVFVEYDKRIEQPFLKPIEYHRGKKKEHLVKAKKQAKKREYELAHWEKQLSSLHDKAYFGWDMFAYGVRFLQGDKGNAYLKFGKAFPLKDYLGGGGRNGLQDKILEEWKKLKEE